MPGETSCVLGFFAAEECRFCASGPQWRNAKDVGEHVIEIANQI